jgi:hypothetical protein
MTNTLQCENEDIEKGNSKRGKKYQLWKGGKNNTKHTVGAILKVWVNSKLI